MTSSYSSLSWAMAKGFIRDRTAVFFTVLFPLMFLVLFGILLSNPEASRSDVIQVGPVALLDGIQGEGRAQLDEVLHIERNDDMAAALEQVRKGDVDAAVEEQGSRIVLHYSAADQVTSATVQAVFRELVQGANLAANPVPPRFELQQMQVEDESINTIQYLTPGLLGWAVATGAMFGAALTLVTWRQKKVLRRLRLSPVQHWYGRRRPGRREPRRRVGAGRHLRRRRVAAVLRPALVRLLVDGRTAVGRRHARVPLHRTVGRVVREDA